MKTVTASCKASVNNVMPVFSVTMGKASVQITVSVWETLTQTYDKLRRTYNLDDPRGILERPETLQNMLEATFDHDELAILTKHSQDMGILDDSIDGITGAHVLAQAIAGIVTVLEHIAASTRQVDETITSEQIQNFGASSHRRRIQDTIEGSRVFARCYDRSQIANLILKAVEDKEVAKWDTLADEDQAAIGWASELPSRNMGLPWGFTILALN